jgi:hypothetical protein
MHIGGIWSAAALPTPQPGQFSCTGLSLHCGRFVTTAHDDHQFLVIEGQVYDTPITRLPLEPKSLETADIMATFYVTSALKKSLSALIGLDIFPSTTRFRTGLSSLGRLYLL